MRIRPAAFALAVLLAACGGSGAPVPADPGPGAAGAAPVTSPTGGVNESRHQPAEYLILISFDGFRADYLDLYETPTLDRVIDRGVLAEGLIPPYPSLTFPSHFTIVTGLWPENHGLVGNRFYDPINDREYNYRETDDVGDGSWYSGEPIWSTAENQGMVAASYFWVGSEAEIAGARPTHWYPYNGSVSGEVKVDQVLAWLRAPVVERPHVITLYFAEVDRAGHEHGPLSAEVEAAVAEVDGYLDRLIRGISTLPHGEQVNLVVVSDHGMAEADPVDAEFIDLSAFPSARFVGGSATASIFVDESADDLDDVYASVRDQLAEDVRVYLRADAPDDFHIAGTARAGDIIIAPPIGVTVWPAGREVQPLSTHGWYPDTPEMHGIFIASGPRIREGARLRAFSAVDVYPFMVELMGLESPGVDGSLETLGDLIIN